MLQNIAQDLKRRHTVACSAHVSHRAVQCTPHGGQCPKLSKPGHADDYLLHKAIQVGFIANTRVAAGGGGGVGMH